MTIEILRPDAPGDKCGYTWGCVACPDHYQCVDEVTPDEGATQLYDTRIPLPATLVELYHIQNHSVGTGPINKVTVRGRFRRSTRDKYGRTYTPRASVRLGLKTGGAEYRTGAFMATTSWADYSATWTDNPRTGSPWTWADIDALQIGSTMGRPASSGIGLYTYCTQMWLEVDYGFVPPAVATDLAADLIEDGAGAVGATLHGTLDKDGGLDCECGFEWGTSLAYGNVTPTATKRYGESFSNFIGGLQWGVTYHFRAFASNAMGTSYGADETFAAITTEILRPNAPGNVCNIPWEWGADCPDHWQNVNDVVPDEDSTAVHAGTHPPDHGWYRDLYNLEDHSLGSGIVQGIRVHARCKGSGTWPFQPEARICIRTGGVVFDGPIFNPSSGYSEYSQEWNINPNTGRGWTWAEIDELQIGINLYGHWKTGVHKRAYCTQVYVGVIYQPVVVRPLEAIEAEKAILDPVLIPLLEV